MALIPWDQLADSDRLFDDRYGRWLQPFSRLGWRMAIDVFEEGGDIVARATLPGVDPDVLDLSLEDGVLTISGTREEEKEIEKKDYYQKEISRGSFSRSVALPKLVDESRVKAEYKDGILTVTLPVAGDVKEKAARIPIERA